MCIVWQDLAVNAGSLFKAQDLGIVAALSVVTDNA